MPILPLIAALLLLPLALPAQQHFPGTSWMQYATPEEAGWSTERLAEVHALADSVGSVALMLVHNGVVVTAWGDVKGQYDVYSIRKSLLSALLGIHISAGAIDTTATLAQLSIDDDPPLTASEREARVIDLIASRSGVYLPTAYEDPALRKPIRGTHAPGTHWYYNNWDFNVLGAVFEQRTGTGLFQDFQQRIAAPLRMEDFHLGWTAYWRRADQPRYPAYVFWLSARDLARFGLLYLREGRWGSVQLVPAEWVGRSTQPRSALGADYRFGLMWWSLGGEWERYRAFMAAGSGGNLLVVLPALDLVFVHRGHVGTESGAHALEMLQHLIAARTGEPVPRPRLLPFVPAR